MAGKGVKANRITTDPGGGDFSLPNLTIGVFLTDQPGHRIAVGRDATALAPLLAQQGWVMPAGAEGVCFYDAPHEFLTVELDGALMTELGVDPGTVAPVVGGLDPLLLHLALNTEAAAEGATLYRETMARATAAHLAATVAPMPPEVAAIDDRRLRRAVAHIRDNLGGDLSLEALAAEAGMTGDRFARAFKSATGDTPLQYVIGARIEAAAVLLTTTDLPVAEIAYRVGYADPARFGQQFRRRMGATPAAYRAG